MVIARKLKASFLIAFIAFVVFFVIGIIFLSLDGQVEYSKIIAIILFSMSGMFLLLAVIPRFINTGILVQYDENRKSLLITREERTIFVPQKTSLTPKKTCYIVPIDEVIEVMSINKMEYERTLPIRVSLFYKTRGINSINRLLIKYMLDGEEVIASIRNVNGVAKVVSVIQSIIDKRKSI